MGMRKLGSFFRPVVFGVPDLSITRAKLEGVGGGLHDLGRPVGQQVARTVLGEL